MPDDLTNLANNHFMFEATIDTRNIKLNNCANLLLLSVGLVFCASEMCLTVEVLKLYY